MKTILSFLSILLYCSSITAQEVNPRKIALLPFNSNGIEAAYVQTAESVLRMELNKESNLSVVSEKKTLAALEKEFCNDEECAKEIGLKLEADQVLLCKLNPLGEKIIVQYQLIETLTGKIILSERATSINLEDLDGVMKRVAISVAKQTPFNANPEVGNIVKQESIETLRRAARYNFGLGFGYLFPSYGYDNDMKRSFTINAYFDYEVTDYSVGLMLGARKGFAINLYTDYLFLRTDVCPFVGAALGFHWVAHENWLFGNEKKEGDGIELGLKGGIKLFHTYAFQIFVQGEYIMTFNDYNDKAFVFTIGIL